MEGQEGRKEVIWDGCVVNSAAVPVSPCVYEPCPLLEDKWGRNTITEIDRGEMAGFEWKYNRLLSGHNSIDIIQIKPNRSLMLMNSLSLFLIKPN